MFIFRFTKDDPADDTVCDEGLPVDFTTLTSPTVTFYFKKPDGTVVTQAVALPAGYTFTLPDGTATAGDGSDGYVGYEVPSTFLDTAGLWYRQARVVSTELEASTNIISFKVGENLWS